MSGSLGILNQALLDQLDRLNNPEIKGDSLKQEIDRASSIIGVAKELNATARTVLDATKLKAEHLGLHKDDTQQLEKYTGTQLALEQKQQ